MDRTQVFVDCSLKEPGKHSPGQTTGCENGRSLPKLFGFVPTTKDIMATDKGRCFNGRLEEADHHDLPWVVAEASTQGQKTPGNHSTWEVDSRSKFLECQIVRDLAKHVSSVEDCMQSETGLPDDIGREYLLVLIMLSCLPWKWRSSLMPLT